MAGLMLRNVAKLYPNGGVGVKDFSLEIEDGEFVVLVGPAGSGKSTLLRMIGGLEEISQGDILIGGERVNDLEPRERRVAMIFRNYMLYPQMTVYENLAFGLKLAGCGREEIARRVEETAALLEIEGLLDKPSEQVEGIDRYKVVVGRALARRPEILLMDDPMISLDGEMRRQMREGLAEIHHRLGVTAVYVTEDASEAMLLGNRLVVMRDGAIEQDGTAEEIYHRPCCRFVAGYFWIPGHQRHPGKGGEGWRSGHLPGGGTQGRVHRGGRKGPPGRRIPGEGDPGGNTAGGHLPGSGEHPALEGECHPRLRRRLRGG